MKLTIRERILLLGLLPEKGNIVTLKVSRRLRESLSFNENEIKELSIKQDTQGRISWDNKKEVEGGSEIDIGEKATDIIVETLQKSNKAEALTEQHISLFDKFIDS